MFNWCTVKLLNSCDLRVKKADDGCTRCVLHVKIFDLGMEKFTQGRIVTRLGAANAAMSI
jgi:hypothetical protein